MKSITAIKEEFKNLTPEEISAQIVLYQNDERKGVQSFLLSQKKKVEKYYQEVERIENLCRFEKEYSQYEFICGIDEVGRTVGRHGCSRSGCFAKRKQNSVY